MGVLAWVVAPWLADQLRGDEALTQALLILLTVGLIWQFVLVLILLRRELGSLEWSRMRDALWLRPPRDPKTGRVGGRVWWWALLFVALVAGWAMVPAIPGPSARDFSGFLGSERGAAFFSDAWGWFALIVVFVVFNTVLGEELALPWVAAAAHASRLRQVGLGRQRGAVTLYICTSRGSCRPPW